MRRTQLNLDAAQYEFLQEESRKAGKSIPGLLREWIDDRMRIAEVPLCSVSQPAYRSIASPIQEERMRSIVFGRTK